MSRIEEWLPGTDLAPRTIDGYREKVRLYLAPEHVERVLIDLKRCATSRVVRFRTRFLRREQGNAHEHEDHPDDADYHSVLVPEFVGIKTLIYVYAGPEANISGRKRSEAHSADRDVEASN
jgi:hypothetical protein